MHSPAPFLDRLPVPACALALALLAGCAAGPAATVPAAGLASRPASDSTNAVQVTRPPGYKVVERNGTTLFCTRVALLGTKFKQEICMTRDEYAEVQRRGEKMRQDLRQTTKMCQGGSGFASCNGS